MTSCIGRNAGVLLLLMAIALAPAFAGRKKKRDNKDGGINPTNIAVVDGDLFAMAAPDATGFARDMIGWQPAAFQVGAPDAHMIATGHGVRVAVLDGGFDLDHPALAGSLEPGFDAIDGDGDPTDAGNGFDDDGDGIVDGGRSHGTFVSAMVLMAAPDSRIVPVRVRDDEGFGSNAEVVAGLEFAMNAGVDVINLSLEAAQAANSGLQAAVMEATSRGIVVVVSAGNSGDDSFGKLADTRGVIVVGAVDGLDEPADFTNTGESRRGLFTFAPGVDIYGPLGSSQMGFWSGTSFSAGIVSGGAALILEVRPNCTNDEVLDAFDFSTDMAWEIDGTPMWGAGRINLARLVWEN